MIITKCDDETLTVMCDMHPRSFTDEWLEHRILSSRDSFFITHRHPREKSFQFFYRCYKKSFFLHHRKLTRRRKGEIVRFLPPSLESERMWRIWKAESFARFGYKKTFEFFFTIFFTNIDHPLIQKKSSRVSFLKYTPFWKNVDFLSSTHELVSYIFPHHSQFYGC